MAADSPYRYDARRMYIDSLNSNGTFASELTPESHHEKPRMNDYNIHHNDVNVNTAALQLEELELDRETTDVDPYPRRELYPSAPDTPLSMNDELRDQLQTYQKRELIFREELDANRRQLTEQERHIRDLQARLDVAEARAAQGDNDALQLKRIERYLQSVPTAEEFDDVQRAADEKDRQCRLLQDEVHSHAMEADRLKKSLDEQIQTNHDTEREVDELRRLILEVKRDRVKTSEGHRNVVEELTTERNHARDMYDKVAKQLTTKTGECQALQLQLNSQEARLGELKAKAEQRGDYLEELQSRERQHVATQRTLRNQIEDHETAKESLLKRLAAQATTIQELRSAIDGLTEQNQEVININHKLRMGAKLSPLEASNTLDASVLKTRLQERLNETGRTFTTPAEVDALQDQLAAAVEEITEMYDLVRTRLFSSDAEVHRLLGLKANETLPPLFTRTSDAETRLEVIKEMRSHIKRLRDGMADEFALELGSDACHVQ